jgi:hypothetical protein
MRGAGVFKVNAAYFKVVFHRGLEMSVVVLGGLGHHVLFPNAVSSGSFTLYITGFSTLA